MSKTKWTVFLRVLGASVMLTFLLASSVFSATSISIHDGPNWTDNSGYFFGVCVDTAYGETACLNYTTDGTPLTVPSGSPPSPRPFSWVGTKVACSFVDYGTTCGTGISYWRCPASPGFIPEVTSGTVNYAAYVVNEAAAGNCNTNVEWQFYGVRTAGTFNTGPNAVTLGTFSASTSALPLAGVVLLGGLGGLALWRRRK